MNTHTRVTSPNAPKQMNENTIAVHSGITRKQQIPTPMTHPVRGGRLHAGRVPRDVAIFYGFYTPQQTVVVVEVATSRKRCVCH